jgi:hypothetical protein
VGSVYSDVLTVYMSGTEIKSRHFCPYIAVDVSQNIAQIL